MLMEAERLEMLSQEIRAEIRPRLEAIFQDRFIGALLFGSEVRGEAKEDSDVDVLVLLREPVQLGGDLERIVEALYPLQLKVDRPIHAFPVSSRAFKAGQYSLYRSARREGFYL